MHRYGIFEHAADDDPTLSMEGAVLRGYVSDDADGPNDEIRVRVPSYDMARSFGPFRFQPQAARNGGILLPSRDDDCLIAFDEDGQPQLVSWWTEDNTTGGQIAQTWSVVGSYTPDRALNVTSGGISELNRIVATLIDDLKEAALMRS